jgi:hypothetical protein
MNERRDWKEESVRQVLKEPEDSIKSERPPFEAAKRQNKVEGGRHLPAIEYHYTRKKKSTMAQETPSVREPKYRIVKSLHNCQKQIAFEKHSSPSKRSFALANITSPC